jgi:hypothetical protein
VTRRRALVLGGRLVDGSGRLVSEGGRFVGGRGRFAEQCGDGLVDRGEHGQQAPAFCLNGAPQALADAILEGFALLRAGTAGFRTDTVRRLLGRAPRTFADWCARNADVFRQAAAA